MTLTIEEVQRAEMILAARMESNRRYRMRHRETLRRKGRENYAVRREQYRKKQAARNKADAELLVKVRNELTEESVAISSNATSSNAINPSK